MSTHVFKHLWIQFLKVVPPREQLLFFFLQSRYSTRVERKFEAEKASRLQSQNVWFGKDQGPTNMLRFSWWKIFMLYNVRNSLNTKQTEGHEQTVAKLNKCRKFWGWHAICEDKFPLILLIRRSATWSFYRYMFIYYIDKMVLLHLSPLWGSVICALLGTLWKIKNNSLWKPMYCSLMTVV